MKSKQGNSTGRGFPDSRRNKFLKSEENETSSLLDSVESSLNRDEILPFDNANIASDYLTLPVDITSVTSKELGKYLNAFTQQKMYVRTLYGRTRTILREYNDELDIMRSKVYSGCATKLSIKEKELRLKSDESYGDNALKIMKQSAMFEEKLSILKEYLDSLTDGIFNISREVSRRESDFEHENRDNNVGRR